HQFEGDDAFDRFVLFGQVDAAHTALAEEAANLIAADPFLRERRDGAQRPCEHESRIVFDGHVGISVNCRTPASRWRPSRRAAGATTRAACAAALANTNGFVLTERCGLALRAARCN